MSNYIHPLQQAQITKQRKNVPQQQKSNTSFEQVLSKATELKVSKHAKQRLMERNIQISDTQWQEISRKMSEAKGKGITDAIVVTNDTSLVVSTKNNTVVTALSNEEASNQVFTNINGAIVLQK